MANPRSGASGTSHGFAAPVDEQPAPPAAIAGEVPEWLACKESGAMAAFLSSTPDLHGDIQKRAILLNRPSHPAVLRAIYQTSGK